MNPPPTTLAQAIARYLDEIHLARSKATTLAYRNALRAFADCLRTRKLDPDTAACTDLPEDAIAWFAEALKTYAPATEQQYLTAARGFYDYLVAENLAPLNLTRVQKLVRLRARKQGQRLPQFPQTDIEKMLGYAQELAAQPATDERARLRNLRDRAFLLTLADTGLRVHEACKLRRGDIDWNEGRALLIGKGDKQAIVRFSARALKALRDYLAARAALDGASGRPLPSLPLFARHDKGAAQKTKPITPTAGRDLVEQRVRECLGEAAVGSITPHAFRHYFVTTVLRGSGGNLKLAQELARHTNISITQRYAHLSDDELDRGYAEIFEENLKR
ncbi:MAG: tyrosine recombinase XerC [Anaerolineales bacterium]